MADFQIKGQNKNKKFDGAYCTVDTFRHLLSEKEAEQHLIKVSTALKKNGIYILGLHLFSDKKITNKVTRWTAKRGRLTVKTSMSMISNDRKKRSETLKVILRAETTKQKESHTSIYQLRTYTLKQFNKLLSSTGVFEIVNAYDHYYDLLRPIKLNNMTDYAVFILRNI